MRMRTMHSILYALSQFDAKAYVVGPPEMSLLPEFMLELDERNVRYEEADSVEDVIDECDVIYMEPVVQADYTVSREERDGGGVATTPRTYQVTRELLREKAKTGLDHPAQPAADGRAAGRRRRDAARPLLAGGVQRRRAADGAARARPGRGRSDGTPMELTLNGELVSVEPREGESLLELLRDRLGLRSVKDGCAPEGSCGACTVIVDGHAVVSCAQKASAGRGQGGRHAGGAPARRRAACGPSCFVAAGASQCGFCSPGIVMKAEALPRARTPSRRARRSRTRCSATSAAAPAT